MLNRKYVKILEMNHVKKIIQEFKSNIEALYGPKFKGLTLYGSYARGHAHKDSDIDLAVILGGDVKPGEEIDRMIDIITEINLKYSVLLSVYPVSEDRYKSANSPLLLNIRKEGLAA
jgi:predicted nucleotidyltransferase